MSSFKRVQQWATFARTWHLYDANWQNPFDSSKKIIQHLQGLHKPIYHPLNQSGDHVVVINCKDIALPGDEWTKRVYFHHTGYPGGASWTLAWELHTKDKTMIMWKAIYNAMDGNLQRRHNMQRVHLYEDDKVPEHIMKNITNQIRPLRKVPKTLDSYTEKERFEFPKVYDYPKDYILNSKVLVVKWQLVNMNQVAFSDESTFDVSGHGDTHKMNRFSGKILPIIRSSKSRFKRNKLIVF